MDNYHITKSGEKWRLKKQGAERASKTASTKQELVDKTREFMKTRSGSVKIHKENGRIQEERTYPKRNDPSKTPG